MSPTRDIATSWAHSGGGNAYANMMPAGRPAGMAQGMGGNMADLGGGRMGGMAGAMGGRAEGWDVRQIPRDQPARDGEYMRAVALLPQRIDGVVIDGVLHPHNDGHYDIERGRDQGGRGRSPRRRLSRSPRHGERRGGRRQGAGIDQYPQQENEEIEDESLDSEIATRVESVEEELRALIEDKRERDADVQERITQALSLARRLGLGLAYPLSFACVLRALLLPLLILPLSCLLSRTVQERASPLRDQTPLASPLTSRLQLFSSRVSHCVSFLLLTNTSIVLCAVIFKGTCLHVPDILCVFHPPVWHRPPSSLYPHRHGGTHG